MILRTVSESLTTITVGNAATAVSTGAPDTGTALWTLTMVARLASATGLRISTTSPSPSTVAPAIPTTRESWAPMFLTTTS